MKDFLDGGNFFQKISYDFFGLVNKDHFKLQPSFRCKENYFISTLEPIFSRLNGAPYDLAPSAAACVLSDVKLKVLSF